MDGPNNGIILYHYSFSPFARRVIWYLALRGIDYAQCIQPPILPRPDVKALGVNYRRIPILAIGRDVYCDTRLILLKLERMFSGSTLSASKSDQEGMQRLLQMWTVEAGVFVRGSQLIPTEMPLLRDPKFTKDREDFSGRSWDKEQIMAMRPEALAHMRSSFKFLETTLLADGRRWILKTDKPTLADIEAIWVFDWLNGLKGALPQDLISGQQYPKVFAWIERFSKELKATRSAAPKPASLKGPEATKRLESARLADVEPSVDENDPIGLKAGTRVEVWPIDSGFRHKDVGTLLGLNEEEVVIGVKTQNGQDIRLHHPRQQFRIKAVNPDTASKL